jgi:hypothetical protein
MGRKEQTMKQIPRILSLSFLMFVVLTPVAFFFFRASAQTAPSFQSAIFYGGAGDQRAVSIGISGANIFVAGTDQSNGLLLKYGTPPGAPLSNHSLANTHFNALALSSTDVYPVGGASPPVCGASDGVGDTERKSLLARYSSAVSFNGCGSTNFFPYRGHEGYNAAVAVTESGSPFIYAGGWAEQTGFSFSFPMVLTKHNSSGVIVNQVTEPGITLGTSGCCPGDSSVWGLTELNGNIFVAGHSRLPGFGEDNVRRPLLMRYDTGLNRIWKVRPSDNPGGMFRGVTGFNGAIYAVGNTGADSSANYLIEKYDTSGNRIWTATSGGGAEDVLTGLVGLGSRLFAVGYTRSSGSGGADVVLLEIDPDTGATLSTTLYGGAQDDQANGIATDGTNLYVVGESRSFASAEGNAVGQNDVLLLCYTLNQAPLAVCQNVTVTADASCTADASINNSSFDPDGDAITFTQSPAGPYSLGTTNVTLTVTDSKGASSQCSATVTVNNPAPTVTINSPASGAVFAVGTPVNFTGSFTDNPGMHTATWMFDALPQAGTVNEMTGAVSASYSFPTAGVYKVKLTVDDGCGETGMATTVGGFDAMVVIYDPNGGFVTGGGWITSPLGAYTPNPALTGKANFGFVSKYQKGASVPTGQTEFQFKVANFNFQSTSYDWLVVAGARAQYKGTGTINGAGSYSFLLTAIDGQINGGGGTDKFRIKIWDAGGVIYDNQSGAGDNDNPTTVLGGGSIVIHK